MILRGKQGIQIRGPCLQTIKNSIFRCLSGGDQRQRPKLFCPSDQCSSRLRGGQNTAVGNGMGEIVRENTEIRAQQKPLDSSPWISFGFYVLDHIFQTGVAADGLHGFAPQTFRTVGTTLPLFIGKPTKSCKYRSFSQ